MMVCAIKLCHNTSENIRSVITSLFTGSSINFDLLNLNEVESLKGSLENNKVSEGGSDPQTSSGDDSRSDTADLELRQTPKGEYVTWHGGTVKYCINHSSYDDVIASRIRTVMDVIQQASCLSFEEIPDTDCSPISGQPLLLFTNPQKERECVHELKRAFHGSPAMVLGYDCMQLRDILHAVMHALGFRDEVTHPRRDYYIRVLWDNVQPKYRHLFTITNTSSSIHELADYDMTSIMQFHDRAYSVNGAVTMVPVSASQVINPSDELSPKDKMKLRLAFGHHCNKRKLYNMLKPCKNTLQTDEDVNTDTDQGCGDIKEVDKAGGSIEGSAHSIEATGGSVTIGSNETSFGKETAEGSESESAEPSEGHGKSFSNNSILRLKGYWKTKNLP